MTTQSTIAPEQNTPVSNSSDVDADGQTEIISFAIGDEHYGVDIMAVQEIRGWTDAVRLPGQPDYMRGVLNLRGAMVPIIDLRCRLGGPLTQATPIHIVIIVQIGAAQIGLLGDRVLDIVAFDSKQVRPVPRVVQHGCADFLSGLLTVDAGMIALLDLASLVSLSDSVAGASPLVTSQPAVDAA
jgi:purine-binding chemotaxis protein CheW